MALKSLHNFQVTQSYDGSLKTSMAVRAFQISAASSDTLEDDQWAFLGTIEAPQWVDLTLEAALQGTEGDDPWFYRSHPHHETPLEDLVFASPFHVNENIFTSKLEPSESAVPQVEKTKVTQTNKSTIPRKKDTSLDRQGELNKVGKGQSWPRNKAKRIQLQPVQAENDERSLPYDPCQKTDNRKSDPKLQCHIEQSTTIKSVTSLSSPILKNQSEIISVLMNRLRASDTSLSTSKLKEQRDSFVSLCTEDSSNISSPKCSIQESSDSSEVATGYDSGILFSTLVDNKKESNDLSNSHSVTVKKSPLHDGYRAVAKKDPREVSSRKGPPSLDPTSKSPANGNSESIEAIAAKGSSGLGKRPRVSRSVPVQTPGYPVSRDIQKLQNGIRASAPAFNYRGTKVRSPRISLSRIEILKTLKSVKSKAKGPSREKSRPLARASTSVRTSTPVALQPKGPLGEKSQALARASTSVLPSHLTKGTGKTALQGNKVKVSQANGDDLATLLAEHNRKFQSNKHEPALQLAKETQCKAKMEMPAQNLKANKGTKGSRTFKNTNDLSGRSSWLLSR